MEFLDHTVNLIIKEIVKLFYKVATLFLVVITFYFCNSKISHMEFAIVFSKKKND